MYRFALSRASLIALLAIVTAVLPAQAQPRGGKARARAGAEAAQVHFERGRAHHERGEYEDAVREYLVAYDLSHSPKLLFNVAQVYLLAGNQDKALLYYEAYLTREPEGEISDLARERIAEIERARSRAADRGARAPDAGDPGAGHGPGALAAREAGAPVPAAGSEAAAGPARDEPGRTRPGRGLRMAGLAVAGLGAVGAAVGLQYGLEARRWHDALESQPPGTPWTFDPAYEKGMAANRNMWIAYGAGAAVLLSGGVLYYLGTRAERREARQWTLAPLWGDAAAGVALAGEL